MARSFAIGVVFMCVCLMTSARATAQEPARTPRLGLTFGVATGASTSGVIGVAWELSDKWAVRPELSFSGRSSTSSSGAPASDAWSFGATVTAIRYVARRENVRAYVGPRFSYSHSWSGYPDSTYTSSTYGVGASVGLQYDLARRIALYGEVGVAYSYASSAMGSLSGGHTEGITSRSGLGVNLYF